MSIKPKRNTPEVKTLKELTGDRGLYIQEVKKPSVSKEDRFAPMMYSGTLGYTHTSIQ